MKNFLDDNFLLKTKTAERLYHEHAAKMPIIDYHCHLSPELMAENHQFQNITQAWLYGDHYKWRGMRTNGVNEKYCTGDATDYEKFEKWAETVPYTVRNPLYHWTHLELKRYFGIDKILNKDTAKEIYEDASAQLRTDDYRVIGLLQKMNVETVCTTDDPIDNLEFHAKMEKEKCPVRVIPAWRPDKAMAVEDVKSYNDYIKKLAEITDIEIRSYDTLLQALQKRHDFFHARGCRLSDHGIETFFAKDYTKMEIEIIFKKVRLGMDLTLDEVMTFKSSVLYDMAIMDHAKGWTQQFHYGAIRNNNTRMFKTLGPDTGFDSIGDFQVALHLSKFLNKLDTTNQLTKTILYNLNPADNDLIATMLGNFQDGSVPGKIQWGSGWWFLDQKYGMENQLNSLSSLGLLSRFVGMLTDSRSFLSFPRHEYFRRILCNLLGNDVENGELPNDTALLGQMVEDICYNNSVNYFKF